MSERPIIHSFGGGTQSAALAVLVLQGKLPRPARIVMADTGREASEVWAYMDAVVNPALASIGLTVEVASAKDYATVDLWGGAKGESLLIPAYTTQAGRVSKLPTFCSNEWKRRVVERWMRANGYGPRNPVVMWLGMSTDELERMKVSPTPWIEHGYPLALQARLNRSACVSLVRDHGWPPPPRSACWMCPHHTDAEWRHLRDTAPEDFAAAVKLDAEIRERDPHAFLHKSGPLAEADLSSTEEPDLFEQVGCASGMCYV